jgi:hypothetical protein
MMPECWLEDKVRIRKIAKKAIIGGQTGGVEGGDSLVG